MVTLVQCAALIAPYASPAKGEGMVTADDYASLIDPTRLLAPYLSPARGEGTVAAVQCAPLIAPYVPIASNVSPGGSGTLPPFGAPSPGMLGCQPFPITSGVAMANRLVSSHSKRIVHRAGQAGRWLAARVGALCEFQQRIWVVSIVNDTYTDTFIVNEGSFEQPMQWMHRKGYSAEMLARVEAMGRSQVIQLELGDASHRLMRVK